MKRMPLPLVVDLHDSWIFFPANFHKQFEYCLSKLWIPYYGRWMYLVWASVAAWTEDKAEGRSKESFLKDVWLKTGPNQVWTLQFYGRGWVKSPNPLHGRSGLLSDRRCLLGNYSGRQRGHSPARRCLGHTAEVLSARPDLSTSNREPWWPSIQPSASQLSGRTCQSAQVIFG